MRTQGDAETSLAANRGAATCISVRSCRTPRRETYAHRPIVPPRCRLDCYANRPSRGADDQPYPLEVEVGKSVAICPTETIICPVSATLCDDTSVAVPVLDTKLGMTFKGLKPGSTLCSAAGLAGTYIRRVYRVTVK